MITHADVFEAVEQWAWPNYWLIPETAAGVDGRLDGLLVPRSFRASVLRRKHGYWTDKLAVVGLEIKRSRADFLRGIREGQLERYASGVFVATGREVKTSEVPDHVGHLVYFEHQRWHPGEPRVAAVCRRLPRWRDVRLDDDTAWRIVFHASDASHLELARVRREQEEKFARIGEAVASAVRALYHGRDK